MPATSSPHRRVLRAAFVCLAAVVMIGAAACDSDDAAADGLVVEALSTRPEMVTGGDVLVGVQASEGAVSDEVEITIDGEATDAELETDDDGRLIGLVGGLPAGPATIEVSIGDERGTLEVVNHPITGPVFSGPHFEMPVCTTEANGLGPPIDDDCSAETVTTLRWADTEGAWHDAADPSEIPADAMTDDDGSPLTVRRELGTIDRSIYWIDVPEDWNGRLVYRFGGGCGTGYTQGFRLLDDPSPALLAAGYATATATFNTFQVMCNSVLSAETMMMVEEHFAETVGVPELTIVQGGSGGAIQQYQILQNYPDLLDAASVSAPFPDAVSIAGDVLDCALLNRYFAAPGVEWTAGQELAVDGHLTAGTCTFWDETFASNVNPSEACSLEILSAASGALEGVPETLPSLPPEDIYDPVDNPDGFRCTLQDANANILGRDPETGFALRPWDNVGVQYGLQALNDGDITAEQFLDLNERIGSFDIDGTLVDERAEAPEGVLETVFETGQVMEGGGDLREVPIITVNVFTDGDGDIHTRDRAFAVLDRLQVEGERPPNFVLWTRPTGGDLIASLTGTADVGIGVIELLDEWATAIADDGSDDPRPEVVERTRPEAAVDNCVTPDGEELKGFEIYDEANACTDAYPQSDSPRTVAGAPLRNDVVKCRLQPVSDTADVYEVNLTAEQQDRLEAIFPDGVCDYDEPSVGRVELAGTWLSYPRE